MRMCEFVDEWYVLRTTQNMENLSVFSHVASASGNLFVGVARLAHFVCGPSRSGEVCARGAQFSFCLQFSVVRSISVTVQWTCCVTHMTRTPQWLKKIALVIPAQFLSLRISKTIDPHQIANITDF